MFTWYFEKNIFYTKYLISAIGNKYFVKKIKHIEQIIIYYEENIKYHEHLIVYDK